MKVADYASKGLVFPGRAGQLQISGDLLGLANELGHNYDAYHAFLATQLQRVGRPRPFDYPDFDSYARDYATAQTIVLAEAFVRNCYGFVESGRALDACLDPSVPLLDSNDQLVGLET